MSLHEAITAHRPAPVTVSKPVARLRLGVSWPTIIVFAVVISYVSGFWVTSLQGAIGSLDRSQPPFGRWLRDSTLMLPLYVVAVLVAVLLARRWFGHYRRTVVACRNGRTADHRGLHLRRYRRGRQQRRPTTTSCRPSTSTSSTASTTANTRRHQPSHEPTPASECARPSNQPSGSTSGRSPTPARCC